MISIITPMYNEEAVIKNVVLRFLKALARLPEDWELIVVNDGSTDRSLQIVQEIAGGDPRLSIVSYSRNKGRGYALRTGFKAAQGDIIVTTEADLSWGEDIVFRLVAKLHEDSDADIVIASPHMEGGGYRNVPLYRTFLSSIGNQILRRVFTGDLTMVTGMTRAYRRCVIESLDLINTGKEIHLEIVSKANALGFRIVEIPAMLAWQKTEGGEKRKSSFKARRLIFSHLLFGFSQSPLLFLGVIGLFFILASLVIGVYIIYVIFETHVITNRPLLILMILLLFTGLQVLIFSFLAYQNKNTQSYIFRLQREILELSRKRNNNTGG